MKLKDATVLVTGANRGIGLAFVRAAMARGARKVYAGARNPAGMTLAGVEPVQLDVTDAGQVTAAARQCTDVTLLINNAGIGVTGDILSPDAVAQARQMMETNFIGPLRMCQAFAPVLAANGGGAILNVLSVASWINSPTLSAYGATKSAAWALTNGMRHALREQRTQVVAMHVGFVDTDLVRDIDIQKSPPEVVVARTLDALEAGAEEVLADAVARQVKRGLSAEPGIYLDLFKRDDLS